jgi:predicted permease
MKTFFARLKNLFRPDQPATEIDAELHSHLQLHIDDNLKAGMPPEEARRDALLKLGGLAQTKESVHDQQTLPRAEQFFRDIRFGLRTLRKNPGFAAIAIITLALGIGVNTAIFSVVYGVLLAPLPFPHPEQVVLVWSHVNGHDNAVSVGDFLDWQKQNSTFQGLIAITGHRFSLSTSGHPEIMQARIVSPGFFDLQGIPLVKGRDFLSEESTDGKNHVAIITHRLWQDRFASDPNILGRELRLDGEPFTIVGVAAAGMPDRYESQLFVPFTVRPADINHDMHSLSVLGRLKPGVTIAQANADMDNVARRIAAAYPLSNAAWSVNVIPLQNAYTNRRTITNLWLLMGAVGFVLLIACVNVSNLLLARGTVRQREVAVRASLGASRGQLFSQFLSESLVIALIGGTLGVALAAVLLKVILSLLPPFSIPTEAEITLNLPVLLFTVAATMLAGLLCGTVPAWQSSRANLNDTLKDSGRSSVGSARHGLRRLLVVLEFALALTLLAGAGLVIHSFYKLTRVDLGFRQDHILTMILPVRPERFTNSAQISVFYDDLLDKISALPGISSAAASSGGPMTGSGGFPQFHIIGQPVGDPSSRPSVAFTAATPDFFQTFGIQISQGRAFTAQDTAATLPVALVNEYFARTYLANLDPLTQRVSIAPPGPTPSPEIPWNIVGVYRNVRTGNIRNEEEPEIIVPFAQNPTFWARLTVRTSGEPGAVGSSIADVVQSIDPELPIDNMQTMDQLVNDSLAGDRFATVFFAGFAGVALLLAAIGIYGVISFTVAQRTHEIGLRMALGASQGEVLRMVLREALILAAVGLAIGLIGSYFVGRTMNSVLFQVDPLDPAALSSVAALLLVAAIAAAYIPARRATLVDPAISLHHD